LLGQAPRLADPGVLGAQSDRSSPTSMASLVDLAEMEGGQSPIGLLIIDSSCTL